AGAVPDRFAGAPAGLSGRLQEIPQSRAFHLAPDCLGVRQAGPEQPGLPGGPQRADRGGRLLSGAGAGRDRPFFQALQGTAVRPVNIHPAPDPPAFPDGGGGGAGHLRSLGRFQVPKNTGKPVTIRLGGNMKVILKENVEHLGSIGDIVKVAPGFARNYLVPKGFAIEATEKNAKALAHTKAHLEYKKNRVLEAAKQLAARIEGISLTIAHQAGADDRLFGAVTNMELA